MILWSWQYFHEIRTVWKKGMLFFLDYEIGVHAKPWQLENTLMCQLWHVRRLKVRLFVGFTSKSCKCCWFRLGRRGAWQRFWLWQRWRFTRQLQLEKFHISSNEKKSSPIIYATFYITTKSRFTKIFIPYPTFSNHLYLLSFIIFGIFFNNCPYIEAFNWNFPTSLTCTFLQSPNYKVLELFVKHQLINWYLERSKIVYYFASRKAPLIRLKIIFRKKGKIKVIE